MNSHLLSHHKINTGYSHLELLISLIILGPLLALTVTLLHRAVRTSHRLNSTYSETHATLETHALLTSLMQELDYHRLPLPPRIHHQHLTYIDGTRLPVEIRGDGITSLRIIPQSKYKISAIINDGYWYIYKGCYQHPVLHPPIKRAHFLGVSPRGIIELSAETQSIVGECQQLRLQQVTSMLVPYTANIEREVQLLVPIDILYTIYVDQRKVLRWLTHQGNRVLENQPILEGVDQIEFKTSINSIISLQTTLFFSSKRSSVFQLFHHLSRITLPTIALNSL